MLRIMIICAILTLGTALSSFLASIKKKTLIKLINIPLTVMLTLLMFASGLYLYAKLNYVAFLQTNFFSDKISLVICGYLYLILSAISGIIIGAIESKSLSKYFKILSFSPYFKPLTVIFLASTVAFSACGVFITYDNNHFELRISEVCAHNFNLIADAKGDFSDYIELYNNSDSPITLSDFYLSDDTDKSNKFKLPEIELPPHEYIIIWADGSNEALQNNNEIHTNFNISDKEIITLTSTKGTVYDSVNSGALKYNIAVTLLDNKFVAAYGTPGKTNENCILYTPATLKTPTLSLSSGFYPEESINLEISSEKNTTIYYTTDGSTPTAKSSKYTSPITITDISAQPNKYVSIKNTVKDYDNAKIDTTPVDKATIIRAIAIDDNGNYSDIVCGTYFVGEVAKKYEGYAILSVVTDPNNLFGDNGICVTGKEYDDWYNNTDRTTAEPEMNFYQHGKNWEREATIQFWDKDGNYVLNQNCGIRVQGNSSRGFAKKRLSFYARNIYSNSETFDAPIFETGVLTKNFYTRADVYDFMAQTIVKDRELSYLDGIPTVCFIDGEFYNVTFIRERHNVTYFKEHYSVKEEDLVVITEGQLDEGTTEDFNEYVELIKELETANTSDPIIYKEITTKIDIQSLIDYMICNIYPNNLDVSIKHNFKAWKSKAENGIGYNDGKWRFASYDMDGVAWSYERVDAYIIELDPFKYTLNNPEKYGDVFCYIDIPFFNNLLNNESFKYQFITTFFDMMNTNYSIDSIGGIILEEYGESESWLWRPLMTTRHSHITEYLKNAFDIDANETTVVLKTEGNGKIKINTTYAISKDNTWEGTYLSGMQISITAEADDGWEFAGWEGDIESDEESLDINLTEDGVDLKAIFIKTGGGN